jgi:hypothetical protein
MEKINLDKIRNYPTVNEVLDTKYGVVGTSTREKFTEQAQAYFTGQLIENARKNAHIMDISVILTIHFGDIDHP